MKNYALICSCAFTCALVLPAEAQSTSAASTPPVPADASAPATQNSTKTTADEIVTMNVFSVEETSGQSYGASNMASASRLNTPIVNVPQTISVVNANLIADLDASTLDEAVRYTPGVSGRVNAPDGLVIHGLSPTTFNHYEDGYLAPPVFVDMADIDRVEILKGPSASIAGASESTGFVNYITKKPLFNDQVFGQVIVGSWDEVHAIADVTGPIPGSQNAAAVRVIASFESSDSFRDFDTTRKFSVFPSFLWHPDSKTDIFVKIDEIENRTPGGYGSMYLASTYGSTATPIVVPANAKIGLNQWLPLNINTSGPNMNWTTDESAFFLSITRHLTDSLTLRQSANYYDYTAGRFYNAISNNLSYDTNGNLFGTYQVSRTATATLSWRFQGDLAYEHNWLNNLISLRALGGYELARSRGESQTFLGAATAAPINLLSPDYTLDSQGGLTESVNNKTKGGSFGYFGNGQLGFLQDRVILTGGVRRDQNKATWTESLFTDTFTNVPTTPVITSPLAGVTVKPVKWAALYAVYSDAGAAATVVPSYPGIPTTDPRQVLLTLHPDTKNKEFGAKFTFFNDNLSIDVSHFDTNQTDVILPITDPTLPGGAHNILTSGNNSTGTEIDISGDITSRLSVYGGYVNDKTSSPGAKPFGGTLELRGVPRDKVQLFARYALFQAKHSFFGVKAGVVHQTSVYGITGDFFSIPGATRADAGIDYTRDRWSFSTGIVNATNAIVAQYAVNQGSNTVDLPRNYYFSVAMKY